MNRKFLGVAAAGLALLFLNGCEQARQALGQSKQAPDEFAVFSRAPLSVPPEVSLRPPRPGAERPQAVNPRDRAQQALISNARQPVPAKINPPTGLSSGEQAVLRVTGALNADPNIRQTVNRETSLIAAKSKSFTDKIVFWQKPKAPGTAVNPTQEARRIRENQALGEPLNEGEVPTIKHKQKALFDGVFN